MRKINREKGKEGYNVEKRKEGSRAGGRNIDGGDSKGRKQKEKEKV